MPRGRVRFCVAFLMVVVIGWPAVRITGIAVALSWAVGAGGAYAGKKSAADRARQDAERAREQARRMEERERAREQREQERQQARQQRESEREAEKQKDARSADNKSSADEKSTKTDEKTAKEEKRTAAGKRQRDDDDDEPRVPNTVAELFQRLSEPAAPGPIPPAAAKTLIAPAPAPPLTKTTAGQPVRARAGTPAGMSGLPQISLERRPEVLALSLPPKSADRAVLLGFKLNGTTALPRLNLGVTRLLAPAGLSGEQALELLRQTFPEQSVEVNQKYRIFRTATGAETPPDQQKSPSPMATFCGTDRCFGAAAIRWQPQLQSCARNVPIGVIDTAFDLTHPAFNRRNIDLRPLDRPAKGEAPRAKAPDWHGTGVLAMLAGEAQSGTPGLISDSRFHIADIFFADTDGQPATDTASLLRALDWLDGKGVKIVNMSLAGPHDQYLETAIVTMARKGVLFVAAVGNDGPTAAPSYPAAYEQVIAVTAVNKDLANYRHAGRGDHVDLAAPGVGIWTALPGGRGTYHSGTSFAVPYATAVLAAIYKELPAKTKNAVLSQLSFRDLGPPGRDPIYGRGLLIAPASCKTEQPMVAAAATTGLSMIGAKAGSGWKTMVVPYKP